MDAGNRLLQQLKTLNAALTVRQRAVVGVTAVLVLGSLVTLVLREPVELAVVAFGQPMSTQQVEAARQELSRQGISCSVLGTDRLQVKLADVDRANAILLVEGHLQQSPSLEADSSKPSSLSGLFTTQSEREAQRDHELKEDLGRILTAIPGVRQATVRWAREGRSGRFARTEKRKATVFVVPESADGLSHELVHALRHGVASAVSDLDPGQVTVFDIASGTAHTADPRQPELADQLIQQARNWSDAVQGEIRQQLAYIPGVQVAVSVRWQSLSAALRDENSEVSPKRPAVATVQSNFVGRVEPAGLEAHSVVRPNQPSNLIGGGIDSQVDHAVRRVSLDKPRLSSSQLNPPTVVQTLAECPEILQVMVAIPGEYLRGQLRARANKSSSVRQSSFVSRAGVGQIPQSVAREVEQVVVGVAGTAVAELDVRSLRDQQEDHGQATSADPSRLWTVWRFWPAALVLAALVTSMTWYWQRSNSGSVDSELPDLRPAVDSTEEQSADTTEDSDESVPRESVEQLIHQHPERASAVLHRWLGGDAN